MPNEAALPAQDFRAEQPWLAPERARLYDAFPFEADLPLYLDLAAGTDGRVLELACGSGRVLLPLACAGYQVTGVDASPAMLGLVREKLAANEPAVEGRVKLVEGDMRSFALGESFALAIIAVKSFAYLLTPDDQLRALRAVAAHLRPGGRLALDLLHPSPAWLLEPPGSLRQDLARALPDQGVIVARTEATVSTDLATQVRIIRSMYETVANDGSVSKQLVEWPYRYTYRFEAEHLLDHAGFEVEGVYGGYAREPFVSDSRTMLFVARRRAA